MNEKKAWTSVFLGLFALYAGITFLAWWLGYLDAIDKRIRGIDGVFYYIYLPSLFFDGDLNFANELAKVYGPAYTPVLTPKGIPANQWSIGPALFWAPFFLLAHGTTLLANLFGAQLETDGFSSLYAAFVYLGNSFYAFGGIFLTVLFLKKYFSPLAVFIAASAIIAASQLTYYFWSLTPLSHNVSFAVTSLFFYLWSKKGLHPLTAVALVLMFLTRWQNLLLAAPLVATSLDQFTAICRKKNFSLEKEGLFRKWIRQNAGIILIFSLGIAVQSFLWWSIYGTPVVLPGKGFHGSGFIDFSRLHIFEVLFGSNHGLFAWHPLLLFGLIGILFWSKGNKGVAGAFLLALVMETILISSIDNYDAGWSFGHRMFVGSLPIFAFGIAYLCHRWGRRGSFILVGVLLCLSLWNQLFIFQYHRGLVPRTGELTADEFFYDKFDLVEKNRIRMGLLEAYGALNQGQEGLFHLLAEKSYGESPPNWGGDALYALSCLLRRDLEKGVAPFEKWRKREPDKLLPRWGLAELHLRANNRSGALALMASSTSPEELRILAEIKEGRESLINREFFKRYNHYLERVIFQREKG